VADISRVLQGLASQALFRAKLLVGEMQHDIEDVFAEACTPFPQLASDLDMRCSCRELEKSPVRA
jgi:uncharacterized Zn finger protein